MNIAEGVAMLEVPASQPGFVMNPTLLWDEGDDDDTAILVDAGIPGLGQKIGETMLKHGVPLERLGKVIITHQDMDHIGSLASIVNDAARMGKKVEVLAHGEEMPYIRGEKPPIKMTPERLAQMPEEQRRQATAAYEALKPLTYKALADGEVLPYCGGIEVIHTPGHTPGHISLYLRQSKTLIAGDAMNVGAGKLIGPVPQYTFDLELATRSLQKLIDYDIETVICYHGGLYRGNVKQRIAELTKG